jgi:hypothetical protein
MQTSALFSNQKLFDIQRAATVSGMAASHEDDGKTLQGQRVICRSGLFPLGLSNAESGRFTLSGPESVPAASMLHKSAAEADGGVA